MPYFPPFGSKEKKKKGIPLLIVPSKKEESFENFGILSKDF